MNRLYLSIVAIVLAVVGATNVNAGCNAPNKIQVTLTMDGPEYVVVGSTNVYTLTFSPSNVDTNGGTFNWPPAGFTVDGSSSGGSIKLIAPTTPSSVLRDKTIKCEFSKTGWSSPTECSAQKKVTVVEVFLDSPDENEDFHMGMNPPTMPQVELECRVSPTLSDEQYRFKIGSLSDPGSAFYYPDVQAVAGYIHPTNIVSSWSVSNNWVVGFGAATNIYGGQITNVSVQIQVDGCTMTNNFSRNFYIVGDALTTTVRNGYINGLTGYSDDLKAITRVIAIKESGGTHFWPGSGIGTASHTRYPLREVGGDGEGFGVMQLTSPDLLRTETIWNWQRNIDKAMGEVSNRYVTAEAYLNTHPDDVDGEMIRREVYHRYNAGPSSRHYWWDLSEGVWASYNYIGCPGGVGHEGHGATHGYRDLNCDGVKDPDGNPYGFPNIEGPNICLARAEMYVDECIEIE